MWHDYDFSMSELGVCTCLMAWHIVYSSFMFAARENLEIRQSKLCPWAFVALFIAFRTLSSLFSSRSRVCSRRYIGIWDNLQVHSFGVEMPSRTSTTNVEPFKSTSNSISGGSWTLLNPYHDKVTQIYNMLNLHLSRCSIRVDNVYAIDT